MKIEHKYTQQILDIFEQINQVPRRSKHEEKISQWLVDWATKNGLKSRRDAVLNVVIEAPATKGYEKAETLVLQGHMDMVCEKTKESNHDFDKDPIEFVFTDDGWLKANETTLGADNAIALAMAMVAATDKTVEHPKLELLFTIDEETGLTGASSLQPGFIEGKQLLNIDSEDEGVFTVGCAGGEDALVVLPFEANETLSSHQAFNLVAGGMSGGHSGVDIQEQRANAIKLLFRAVKLVCDKTDLRLSTVQGGTARNAIPRDSEAVVLIPTNEIDIAKKIIAELNQKIKAEYSKTDPNFSLTLKAFSEEKALGKKALTAPSTRLITNTIYAFPNGVADMSQDIKGLVETSNNLAKIDVKNSKVFIVSNQRSSNMDKLTYLCDRVMAVGTMAGGDASTSGKYPSWKPNMDSKLLARCVEVYEKRFQKKPIVEVIHAGLECGIIGSKYEGMDMISFGPTIKNPHSPDEMINIETIGQVWDFMIALFESYK